MRYYIADFLFFHAAMNDRMDYRKFHNVEEMNECMISKGGTIRYARNC